MHPNEVFVDTWGWLALGYKKDRDHNLVKELFLELKRKKTAKVTTDFVLDELITILFHKALPDETKKYIGGILKTIDYGDVSIVKVQEKQFQEAWILKCRFLDKPRISFTDLSITPDLLAGTV